jgi:hypothetical protein
VLQLKNRLEQNWSTGAASEAPLGSCSSAPVPFRGRSNWSSNGGLPAARRLSGRILEPELEHNWSSLPALRGAWYARGR